MKPNFTLTLILSVSALATLSGLYAAPAAKPTANPTVKPATTATANTKAPKAGIKPEELAKIKKVPASLKNPQGEFTLVAVVEGVDANQKLTQSLKVVGAQRKRLAVLTRQFDQTAPNLPQQRELLATQINEIRKTLQNNLQFMAQNFAYSLNFNYVLVPHEVELIEVTEKKGKPVTKLAYAFKNADSYDDCQKKRATYFKLKQEQIKKAQASPKNKTSAKDKTKPAVTPEIKPTPAMKKVQQELIKLYKYDPEKSYQINFKKTALYARRNK